MTIGNSRTFIKNDLGGSFKVVVFRHLIIALRRDRNISKLLNNTDLSDRFGISHTTRITEAEQAVIPELSVRAAIGNMIRGSTDKHLIIRSESLHLIILAAESKELARQVFLKHLILKL